MPRIARLVIKEEPAVYHVMSRTALDGYVLGDVEKDYLVKLFQQLSRIYFTEVLGYCVMGNHFHLCVRMLPGDAVDDDEIEARFKRYYGKMLSQKKRKLLPGQIESFRLKWADLSEFVREIKQRFSRYYNRLHKRRGYFWADRFKSVIVEQGETLINLLAYIDLNPVRAGLVSKPEDYRWGSLGYHVQAGNRRRFLSWNFGLEEFGLKGPRARLRMYRDFVYSKGRIGEKTPPGKASRKAAPGLSRIDRFGYRTRYFSDSGIIGSKAFVSRWYNEFKPLFESVHEKQPKRIQGLEGVYSLKRLTEGI